MGKNGEFSYKTFPETAYTTRVAQIITFYTDRTEIATTPETGIWGQGLEDVDYLLEKVEKERYRHGQTLEVVSSFRDSMSWPKDERPSLELGRHEIEVDETVAYLLGSLARRVAFPKNRILIRIPKGRSSVTFAAFAERAQETEVLAEEDVHLQRGQYWDWIVMKDERLASQIGKLWPNPTEIPQQFRAMPGRLLLPFCEGLLDIFMVSSKFLVLFLEERLARSLIYHYLTITTKPYLARPRPLYRAYDVEMSLGPSPSGEARIRSWEITQGKIVDWEIDDPFWSPLANLSMVQPLS